MPLFEVAALALHPATERSQDEPVRDGEENDELDVLQARHADSLALGVGPARRCRSSTAPRSSLCQ